MGTGSKQRSTLMAENTTMVTLARQRRLSLRCHPTKRLIADLNFLTWFILKRWRKKKVSSSQKQQQQQQHGWWWKQTHVLRDYTQCIMDGGEQWWLYWSSDFECIFCSIEKNELVVSVLSVRSGSLLMRYLFSFLVHSSMRKRCFFSFHFVFPALFCFIFTY